MMGRPFTEVKFDEEQRPRGGPSGKKREDHPLPDGTPVGGSMQQEAPESELTQFFGRWLP